MQKFFQHQAQWRAVRLFSQFYGCAHSLMQQQILHEFLHELLRETACILLIFFLVFLLGVIRLLRSAALIGFGLYAWYLNAT